MAKYHELIKYKGKHYAEVIRSKLKKKIQLFYLQNRLFNLVFSHMKKGLLNLHIIIDHLKE